MKRFTPSVSNRIVITGILIGISTSLTLVPHAWAEKVPPPTAPHTIDWWPMLSHDSHNSGFSTSSIPNTPVINWQIPGVYGNRRSYPAIVDGKVYVKSSERLLCLDAATGGEYWNYVPPEYHYMSGSPTCYGGLVYNGIWCTYCWPSSGSMLCLDADTGSEVWNKRLTGNFNYSAAYMPIVCNDRLYYRTHVHDDYGYSQDIRESIWCRDRFDGELIWDRTYYDTDVEHSAILGCKSLFVNADYEFIELDADSGRPLWSMGYDLVTDPVIYEGKVYGRYWGQLVCLDAGSHKTVWAYDGYIGVLPAVGQGRVYTDLYPDLFLCLDAETGDEIWSVTYDQVNISSPTVGDGKVLFATNDDVLHCLDAENGNELWTMPLAIYFSYLDRPIAVADGRIFVSTKDHTILCIGEPEPTLSTAIGCNPVSGTLPFTATLSVTLENTYAVQARTVATHIDVTLGCGTFFSNWRMGYLNIEPDSIQNIHWSKSFPQYASLIGSNVFQIISEDVTPPPYNQPPYPPAGDTATAACTVTGMAP